MLNIKIWSQIQQIAYNVAEKKKKNRFYDDKYDENVFSYIKYMHVILLVLHLYVGTCVFLFEKISKPTYMQCIYILFITGSHLPEISF